MTFANESRKTANRFLQTVLVVDDRAFDEQSTPKPPPKVSLKTPGRGGTKDNQPSTEAEKKAEGDSEHDFEAEVLIKEFSTRNLFCSVLSPKEGDFEELSKQISPVALTADILVFDWVLAPGGSGEGQETLQLIQEIIEFDDDTAEVDRLRQIAIYTGTPNLYSIVDKIRESLEDNIIEEQVQDVDDFTLRQGNVQVSVYAKDTSSISEDNPPVFERKKSLKDLPDALISDFTDMTRGLVSNTAVYSLAVLRENASRLLSTFHRGLDAPYLEHRAMLTNPEDAEEYLVRLITSEIGAVLEAADARTPVDMKSIEAWLDHVFEDLPQPETVFKDGKEPDKSSLLSLIEQGAGGTDLPETLENFGKYGRNAHKKGIAETLSANGFDSEDSVFEFAALTLLQSKYSSSPPMLTLGTILREKTEGTPSYWLCVQPRCDSVRIKDNRNFPLLPTRITSGNKKRHLIIKDGGKFQKLKINFTPHEVEMITFAPRQNDTVIKAEHRDKEFIFRSVSGVEYTWVSDLKFEQAQRIAQQYANKIARVGLDESERLRRRAPW